MRAMTVRLKYLLMTLLAFQCLSLGLGWKGLGWSLAGEQTVAQPVARPLRVSQPAGSQARLQLEEKQFPQGTLYVLKVPANSGFKVQPFLSSGGLGTIESPVWQNGINNSKPLFVLNGGFFDPNNALTTSFVFQEGALAGDPRVNPQLVNNPKLVPYLPKIFNRAEFRSYLCQSNGDQLRNRYDIVPHNVPIPEKCLLQQSLGAGPNLLPRLESQTEGFVDYNAQGKITRDPIGVCAQNARSAVGLTANGDVILMMGAQNPGKPYGSGFSLSDMANLLKARGAQKAMALDGGSSSSLLFNGRAIYGKASKDGSWVKRPVKSVLMVTPQ